MKEDLRTVTDAPIYALSGVTGEGVPAVLRALYRLITEARTAEAAEEAQAEYGEDDAPPAGWSPEVTL